MNDPGVWTVLAVLGPDLTPAEWSVKLDVHVLDIVRMLAILYTSSRM